MNSGKQRSGKSVGILESENNLFGPTEDGPVIYDQPNSFAVFGHFLNGWFVWFLYSKI